MVAAGIGAGIVIVIIEVLYYKHKGWRKQQQKVIKKTTEQWQEHVNERKQAADQEGRARSRARGGGGSGGDENQAKENGNSNGVENHLNGGPHAAGFKNPIYSRDDVETSVH